MEPGFEEQWRERFEEFAQNRDDDAGIAGWTRTGLDTRLRRFLALWTSAARGERWLDAGCGAGTYSRTLASRSHEVIGVDYSVPTVTKARAREIPHTHFAVADVRSLPFRPGAFRGALCFGVTQALDQAEPAVHELARVVADDGEVWVDGLNKWCVIHLWGVTSRRLRGRPRHLRYESPGHMVAVCRRLGFEDVDLHWMPVFPARAQRLQRLAETPAAQWLLRYVPGLGALLSHSFIIRARGRASQDGRPASPA